MDLILLISLVANLVIGILLITMAVKWSYLKEKYSQLIVAFTTIRDAIADDKVTNEEVLAIVEAFRKLFGE